MSCGAVRPAIHSYGKPQGILVKANKIKASSDTLPLCDSLLHCIKYQVDALIAAGESGNNLLHGHYKHIKKQG
jgi:hypothetical protein